MLRPVRLPHSFGRQRLITDNLIQWNDWRLRSDPVPSGATSSFLPSNDRCQLCWPRLPGQQAQCALVVDRYSKPDLPAQRSLKVNKSGTGQGYDGRNGWSISAVLGGTNKDNCSYKANFELGNQRNLKDLESNRAGLSDLLYVGKCSLAPRSI